MLPGGELSWTKKGDFLFLRQQFIGIDLFENNGLTTYPLSYAYLLDETQLFQPTQFDGCNSDKEYFCGVSSDAEALSAGVSLLANKLALVFRRAKSKVNTEVFLNISPAMQDKESYSKFLTCMGNTLAKSR